MRCLIKKWICTLLIASTCCVVKGQSYYHAPNDSIIANANMNDGNVYNILQIHTLNDTLFFHWKKFSVVIPASWEASICDYNQCFPGLMDSSIAGPVVAGDNGIMSLHVNPHSEPGTAVIRYLLFASNSTTQVDTLTWVISALAPTLYLEQAIHSPAIFPNPANEQFTLTTQQNRSILYQILDAKGRLIMQGNSEPIAEVVSVARLPEGVYFLRTQELGKAPITQKLIIQH